MLLCLFCGLRKGELLALTFDDFDFIDNVIQINKQLVRHAKLVTDVDDGYRIENSSLKYSSPKTQHSIRNLRVPKVIMQELRFRKEYMENQKTKIGFTDKNLITCQENGNYRSLSSLNQYLTRLCQRNGLPQISVHGLRHMFATILLERGVSIVKISALLGHNSIHTTFEFYCEIMDEREKIKAFMNNNFIPEEKSA